MPLDLSYWPRFLLALGVLSLMLALLSLALGLFSTLVIDESNPVWNVFSKVARVLLRVSLVSFLAAFVSSHLLRRERETRQRITSRVFRHADLRGTDLIPSPPLQVQPAHSGRPGKGVVWIGAIFIGVAGLLGFSESCEPRVTPSSVISPTAPTSPLPVAIAKGNLAERSPYSLPKVTATAIAALVQAAREQARPPGEVVRGGRGLEATLVGYDPDAGALVESARATNRPLDDGFRYIVVRMLLRNEGGGPTPTLVTFGDFRLVGTRGQVYHPAGPQSCGMFPNPLYASIAKGSEASGNICWKIPADEHDLILIWESDYLSIDGEIRYLAVGS